MWGKQVHVSKVVVKDTSAVEIKRLIAEAHQRGHMVSIDIVIPE